jgi:hypothetical protein
MPDWLWDFLRWSFSERELAFVRQVPTAVGKIFAVVTVFELIFFFLLFSWFYGERIETLRERIQSRDDQIARLKTQPTDSAKQEIDKLRSELTELREGHPYTIPQEDEVEFIQVFRSVGPYDMEIVQADDDEDRKAFALAKRLSDLFVSSGWSVKPLESHIFGREQPPGVLILVNREQGISSPAAGLLKAFLAKPNINIDARIQNFQPYEGGLHTLKIFVGPAPKHLPKR